MDPRVNIVDRVFRKTAQSELLDVKVPSMPVGIDRGLVRSPSWKFGLFRSSSLLVLMPLLALTATFNLPGSVLGADKGINLFESRIRPIFVKRCEKCHGAQKARRRPAARSKVGLGSRRAIRDRRSCRGSLMRA